MTPSQNQSLSYQTIWNLIGQLIPLVLTFITIPIIIRILGIEKFGILSLTFSLINYFNLFDFGISLGLTHELSKLLHASDNENKISKLIWSTLTILLILGIMGTLLSIFFLKPLVNILKCPVNLQTEALGAFRLIILYIPIVMLNSGFKSILQAYQRFDLINIAFIPIGILNPLGMVYVAHMTNSVVSVVLYTIVLNIILTLIYVKFCIKILPFIKTQLKIDFSVLRNLLRFGGWMSFTNIIGPFLVYLDRFMIGATLSITAVSYYTTPYDLVTKLWIIPSAVCIPLFAKFSNTFSSNSTLTIKLFSKGLKYVLVIIYPVALLIMIFAEDGLGWWLGRNFASNSYKVLQWLCFGVFLNSLAQIAFQLIIGSGRPDITAKIHILEFPLYLITLFILIPLLGIEGAAIAWVLRIAYEFIFLFTIAINKLKLKFRDYSYGIFILLIGLLLMTATFILNTFIQKMFFTFVALSFFFTMTWKYILNEEERLWLKLMVFKKQL